jgi:hypothetical protein
MKLINIIIFLFILYVIFHLKEQKQFIGVLSKRNIDMGYVRDLMASEADELQKYRNIN